VLAVNRTPEPRALFADLARGYPQARPQSQAPGTRDRRRAFFEKLLDSSDVTPRRDLATRAQIARETRHDARQDRFCARAVPRRENGESSRSARTAAPKITVVFVNAC
jgi:hypothetical protein